MDLNGVCCWKLQFSPWFSNISPWFPHGFRAPVISTTSSQEATADAEQRWAEEALAEVQAAEELAMEEVEAQEARRDFWSLGGAPGFVMIFGDPQVGKVEESRGQTLGDAKLAVLRGFVWWY